MADMSLVKMTVQLDFSSVKMFLTGHEYTYTNSERNHKNLFRDIAFTVSHFEHSRH
jgi:hypothetical protein